jgi:hypothetical protein
MNLSGLIFDMVSVLKNWVKIKNVVRSQVWWMHRLKGSHKISVQIIF